MEIVGGRKFFCFLLATAFIWAVFIVLLLKNLLTADLSLEFVKCSIFVSILYFGGNLAEKLLTNWFGKSIPKPEEIK